MDELLSETRSWADNETAFDEPPEPKNIGSGIVKSVLGKGGASIVYEIWNPKLEISRAVKLWRPVKSEKTLQRFETEIKITAKLHHPNIVEIHAVGEWNGLPYIEMEKIQGLSLKELLRIHGALPEVVATAISLCICRALVYAHNHEYTLSEKKYRGVVHCDIKPANIMISDTGTVKLMDFGIAHPSTKTEKNDKSKVTGSLLYMSPEQLQSKSLDQRSDIYSFGVMLYEMYSGVKAFSASSLQELIKKRKLNEFASLRSFCKQVPQRIRWMIEKCMAESPAERFQCASELMDELQKNYQKQTLELPESVIAQFLAGKIIKKRSKQLVTVSKPLFISVVSLGLVVAVLYGRKFMFTEKNVLIENPVSTSDTVTVQKEIVAVSSQHNTSVVKPPPVKKGVKKSGAPKEGTNVKKNSGNSEKIKANNHSEPTVQTVETALSSVPDKQVPKNEPVADGAVLDEIKRLISSSDLNRAEKMLNEFKINDGEYFLLKADLLYKRQHWSAARDEAEKALRVAAGRISPSELRERVFVFRAKTLAAEFDNSQNPEVGKSAMEAWYDVKYMYRTNTSNPNYIKADTEIRRISAVL
ncbi:MAG: protein kinase [Fibrobacter sp.]|mgnify:CR=1 FL=1|nr:protein kinase [Fibrobacter sp.]